MAIQVVWDNDKKTVIRYIYDGRWTWDDFALAHNTAYQLMDTVDYRVGVIVDVRNSSMLPNSILSRSRTMSNTAHPNEGTLVIVGANAFVRSIFDAFRKVYGNRSKGRAFELAPNLEVAREFLDQYLVSN